MNLLIRVDERVLAIVQAMTHKFQLLTGKTNFFLAKLVAAFLCAMMLQKLVGKFRADLQTTFGNWWDIFFTISLLLWFYDVEEHQSIRRIAKGFRNPVLIDPMWRTVRLLYVFAILGLHSILLVLWLIAYLISGHIPSHGSLQEELPGWLLFLWLYLIACDPLPPCLGKIREWLLRLWGNPEVATVRQRASIIRAPVFLFPAKVV